MDFWKLLFLCFSVFTSAELAEHKSWMDDAQDRKDDVREALAAKDGKKLVEAVQALDQLTAREEAFWARTKLKQAQEIAAKNRSEARELLRAAQASRFAAAETAFASLEKTCSSCHDLHFEKGDPFPAK
jgi:hypothetical protein